MSLWTGRLRTANSRVRQELSAACDGSSLEFVESNCANSGFVSPCPSWTWAGFQFAALTLPDISTSTVTTGFTFRRKLLGSLIPHFT